jgi:hypothetical protein
MKGVGEGVGVGGGVGLVMGIGVGAGVGVGAAESHAVRAMVSPIAMTVNAAVTARRDPKISIRYE